MLLLFARFCYYNSQELGFYYLQSRYYDPATGRFLNADDVSYLGAGGLISYNLFAYCGNNPVMGYDPEGFWNWGVFTDILVNVFAIGIGVGIGMSTFKTTASISFAITKGIEAAGTINNLVNAIYYEFSDGKSNSTANSYVNNGYLTRWERLDYAKSQTGETHYFSNAWRYNSEYSLHMYGWLVTGWAENKDIILLSKIAKSCKDADVDQTHWDSRPWVNVGTFMVGMVGV